MVECNSAHATKKKKKINAFNKIKIQFYYDFQRNIIMKMKIDAHYNAISYFKIY